MQPEADQCPTPSAASSTRRSSLRRALKILIASACAATLGGGLAVALIVTHYASGLPDVRYLRSGYDPPQMSRILAADGTVLATEFVERRTVVPFQHIPDVTKLAFLAGEDARFYEHGGLSYTGLLRALWVNVRSGGVVQGASTITQQVAEDVLLGHPVRRSTRCGRPCWPFDWSGS
jgi:penicillin-binding protein 1A